MKNLNFALIISEPEEKYYSLFFGGQQFVSSKS
jgi:hypothetical protein